MVASAELKSLLQQLDEAFDRRAWHGTNLRGSIRGLDAAAASRRPSPGRHNIWELVVHAAYWKYAVRRRLAGDKRGSFPLKGSNWFSRPDTPSESAWQEDVALLGAEHRRLLEVARGLDPRRLHRPAAGGRTTPATLLRSIALHDVYHAGQIQLLKKLNDLREGDAGAHDSPAPGAGSRGPASRRAPPRSAG